MVMSLMILPSSGQRVFKKFLPGIDVYHDQGMIYFSRPVQIDSISCDSKTGIPLSCDGKSFVVKNVDIVPELEGEDISDEQYVSAYLCPDSIYILDFEFKTESVRKGFLSLMTESFDTRKYIGYFPYEKRMQIIYREYKYNYLPSVSVLILLGLILFTARNIFNGVDDSSREEEKECFTGGLFFVSFVFYLCGWLRDISIQMWFVFLIGIAVYGLVLLFIFTNYYYKRIFPFVEKCNEKLHFNLKWLLYWCAIVIAYCGVAESTSNLPFLLMTLPIFAIAKWVKVKRNAIASVYHKIIPKKKPA